MAYGIVELLSVQAHNNDAMNYTFVSSDAIENGSVFTMGTRVTSNDDQFNAVKPATAALADQFYMAASTIRVVTTLGDNSQFVDLTMNPKAFRNEAGEPIDGVALKIHDRVRLSEDAIGGSKSSNTYIVATNADYQLNWAAAAISGLSLKLLGTSYFTIADGFGSQRVTAYDFIVEAVA
jgi:hypothetical protein